MKKLLFLFAVLLASVGAWAITYPTEGVMYTIKNVHGFVNNDNGYKHYMAANAGRTEVVGVAESAISYRAKWFFEKVSGDELDNSFYLKNAFTGMYAYIANPTANQLNVTLSFENKTPFYLFEGSKGNGSIFIGTQNSTSSTWGIHGNESMDTWEGSGDGNQWLIEESTVTNAADADYVTSQKSIIKTAPGYPKTTAQAYLDLYHMPQGLLTEAEIDALVTSYKTCADIILPEDGKAYTFTSVMGDAANATRYYMKYVNGQKVSVSTASTEASVFVCKELSSVNANEKKFAFVTADGHILTWVGNDEGNAYKENDNIHGYSSNFATEYNGKSDWNEITVKKNGTEAKDFGYLRLVARRNSSGTSSIIANKNNRFDQANDGYWFNGDNSSAWILTEVEPTNTAEQTAALAEIDATVEAIAHVDANASKLRIAIGYAYYMVDGTKTIDTGDVKTAINNATSADEVNTIKNSFAYEIPEAQTKYVLYDVAHKVFLDINNLATAPEQDHCKELATLNSEKQSLYITASANQWKIHTTAEGGNYLGQYTDEDQWNSRVHADLSDFEWEECPMDVDGEILYSLKNNSGKENGYLGAEGHTNDKALFVNKSEGSNQLKFRLHKSDLVYKLVVNGHPTIYTIIYNEKKYNNGDFIFADDIIAEADITISELPGYNKALTIDEATKTVTVTFSIAVNFSEGDKIFIRNRENANDYIFADFSGGKLDNTEVPTTKKINHTDSNIDYRFCWELKATTHGEEQCFYLYNPYYDWYAGSIIGTTTNTLMSKTTQDAGKYKIEIEDNHFVFHCLTSNVVKDGQDCNFFHWYSWWGGGLVGWQRSATASHWIIEEVTEEMEAQWQNTLTSQFNTLTQYEAGTGVGQYSGMSEQLVEDFNALALPEEASAIEKARYCVHALYVYGSAVDALTLNLPETGKFYYIQSANTNQYLSNVKSDRTLSTTTDKSINNIFYFETDDEAETYLVAYENGHYVTNPWNIGVGEAKIPNTDEQYKQSKSFVEGQVGKYALEYSASDNSLHYFTASGSSTNQRTDKTHNEAQWNINPVTSLPFTFKKAARGFATFNAPVAVQLPARVLAYIADMVEEENVLQMYRLEGNEIPANTPVMLYNEAAKADDAPDETTIDLEIVDAYTGDEFEKFDGENDFVGTIAAENLNADKNCYSLQVKKNDPTKVGFYIKTTDTKGGFKAWIETDASKAARAFTIIFDGDDATGLKEALGLENENVEIYDLSGRRLDKPAKGVNVIGGKLVIK